MSKEYTVIVNLTSVHDEKATLFTQIVDLFDASFDVSSVTVSYERDF